MDILPQLTDDLYNNTTYVSKHVYKNVWKAKVVAV